MHCFGGREITVNEERLISVKHFSHTLTGWFLSVGKTRTPVQSKTKVYIAESCSRTNATLETEILKEGSLQKLANDQSNGL